jgi:starch phosphorylase
MEWVVAWDITQKTFGYTNHTLLPEAQEKWSLELFQKLLPRHLEIIYEINYRFLNSIRTLKNIDETIIKRMSIIDESGEKCVRMAHLATVGSHAINGVAELHTELLKNGVLGDFYQLNPEKFFNITNGVTPRRWIILSNHELSKLITKSIGKEWINDMEKNLPKLEAFKDDSNFQIEWQTIKLDNKKRLAKDILDRTGIIVDPNSLFDIQVKRIHEYKRQLLNVLHLITRYLRIKKNPQHNVTPRTIIIGGKSAPGYFMAKLIIKLINNVADVVNNDTDVAGRLKVVFYPDFNVKNAHNIYPAADLSEQISTAGTEASGTGNMKFSMNGALTIGTLDGANIEIMNAVGKDNFFAFGLTAQEVNEKKIRGYNPQYHLDTNHELRDVINSIDQGLFSNLFTSLVGSLQYHDHYMLFADYASYIVSQDLVDLSYNNQQDWTKKSIINVARMGKFSSDRSIREYAEKIWHINTIKFKT